MAVNLFKVLLYIVLILYQNNKMETKKKMPKNYKKENLFLLYLLIIMTLSLNIRNKETIKFLLNKDNY